jgi:RimJ/RimL family protein N-acetyltransferase
MSSQRSNNMPGIARPPAAPHLVIETERLRLRPHGLGDYEACLAMWRDPRVLQFLRVPPITPEVAWHRLLRYAGHWALLGYGLFVIEDRRSGCFLGEVGVADFRRGLGADFDGSPEAAWVLSGEAHGRGVGFEAATAALGWADRKLGGVRTVCIIDPDNQASLKLAAKCGFTPFGRATYRDTEVLLLERDPPHLPMAAEPR